MCLVCSLLNLETLFIEPKIFIQSLDQRKNYFSYRKLFYLLYFFEMLLKTIWMNEFIWR